MAMVQSAVAESNWKGGKTRVIVLAAGDYRNVTTMLCLDTYTFVVAGRHERNRSRRSNTRGSRALIGR